MKTKNAITGIYQIKNALTNECYVGSSINVQKRLSDHIKHLASGTHINKLLQNSWKEYGFENFVLGVLEVVENDKDLLEREIYWIQETKALENGFNTKTDQNKHVTVVVVDIETKIDLENLEMGSMQSTVSQLLKFYKHNSHVRDERGTFN